MAGHGRVGVRARMGRVGRLVVAVGVVGGFGVIGAGFLTAPASAGVIAPLWTPVQAALLSGVSTPSVNLTGISCPAPGSCVAVGAYLDASNRSEGMVETLAGGIWTSSVPPLPSGSINGYLNAVSCTAVGACVAAGTYFDSGGNEVGLFETLSGGSWTPTAAVAPGDATADPHEQLQGISCPAAGSCTAVGQYINASGTQGVIQSQVAGSWTSSKAPLPSAAANPDVVLQGASCPAVGSCVAVGSYVDAGDDGQGLIETLAAGTWTPTGAPLPGDKAANPFGILNGVSCPSAAACTAVGSYVNASGKQSLVDTFSSGWTASSPAPPGGAATNPDAPLNGVSCTSATSCEAVGSYVNTANVTNGLIDSLVSGTWVPDFAPEPSDFLQIFNNGVSGALFAASCPAASSCVLSGQYTTRGATLQGMLEMPGQPGEGRVFAQSSGGALYQWDNGNTTGEPWAATNLSALSGGPNVVGTPSGFVAEDGLHHVYARSSGGHLIEFVDDGLNGHQWNAYDLSFGAGGGGAVGGDPSAFDVFLGGLIHVYVQAGNGDLTEYVDDNVGGHLWNAYDLSFGASGGGPIVGAPSALQHFLGDNLIHVFARSASGQLVEYVNGNVGGHLWNAWDLSAGASDGGTVGDSPDAIEGYPDGLLHVLVQGPGGALMEYVNGNVGGQLWNAWDLSAGASGGGGVSGKPSVMEDGGSLLHVYAQGPGGHLVEYVDGNVGGHLWNAWDLSVGASGGGTVAGSPSAYENFEDGLIHVYAPGPGGDLVEYDNGNVGGVLWNAWDLTVGSGGPPIGAGPDAFFAGLLV